MENVPREEKVSIAIRSEETTSFSSGLIFPVGYILVAFGIMSAPDLFFPFALRLSAFALFTAACLWDVRGLVYSSLLSLITFSIICPRVFSEFPSLVFFCLLANTSFIVAMLKKMWISKHQAKQKEIEKLKAWERHYYAFRTQSLAELEEIKRSQEALFFLEEQVHRLEKERIETFLEEDDSQKSLIEQLRSSQEKCQRLQQEVELLEEVLSIASEEKEVPETPPKITVKAKTSRKKKSAGEVQQEMLF